MMRKLLIMFLAVSLSGAAIAQPAIRPDHPRLFFNSETWPAIKARTESSRAGELKELLKEVDSYTDEPVAGNTGPIQVRDRNLPIGDIREFGRQAAASALAWRFTGEDKYLQKAKKMLKVSVDAYTEATKNRRPVGWYTHNRVNAACAYDWIYEALTPEERESIIVPFVKYVEMAQPEYGLEIPRNSGGSKETGYYGTAQLMWFVSLAAVGDGFCDELAAKLLKRGYDGFMDLLAYRQEHAGDDGGLSTICPNYSLGHYCYSQFNFFYTMISATGINPAADYPGLALFPNWIWWTWIRESKSPLSIRFAGSGDSYHNTNLVSSVRLWEQLSEFLQFYKDAASPDVVGQIAALRDFGRVRTIRTNVYPILPFIVETDFAIDIEEYRKTLENLPLKARHFETMGQVLMRSAWTPEATYCTFTTGSVIPSHKHFDENNFSIYKYDHLALDSGDRAKETDFNLCYYYSQSVAHNVVLIHKPGEPLPVHWGIKSTDPDDNRNYGGMTELTGSKTLAFETNDDYSYVASDATSCYGDKCTEAVRQFVFVHPDYFIVYDRVGAADSSYRKEWLLHTKEKPSVRNRIMNAASGDGRLFCQTLLPEDASLELEGGKDREYWVRDRNYPLDPETEKEYRIDCDRRGRGPYTGAWRLEVKPGALRNDDRFLHVLTAAYADVLKPVPAKLVRDMKRDGVELKIDGRKMTFWFNREGEVGGEVVIGSTSRPLTDEVQPQSGVMFE